MTTAMMEISNLSFDFKDRHLFNGFNLTVECGKIVTLMGENGSGKTTLIKLILGYLNLKNGSIKFKGKDIGAWSRTHLLNEIAWVIGESEEYPAFLKVGQYFKALKDVYANWDHNYCNNLLERFELDPAKSLNHLSLGENSKVRFCRALSQRPDLLILDEFTANLSPTSKEVLVQTLLEDFSERDFSVFVTSHNDDESIRLSDNIIHLGGE